MIYSNLGKFVKYGLFRAPYCFVMKKSSYTFLLIALSVALDNGSFLNKIESVKAHH